MDKRSLSTFQVWFNFTEFCDHFVNLQSFSEELTKAFLSPGTSQSNWFYVGAIVKTKEGK